MHAAPAGRDGHIDSVAPALGDRDRGKKTGDLWAGGLYVFLGVLQLPLRWLRAMSELVDGSPVGRRGKIVVP